MCTRSSKTVKILCLRRVFSFLGLVAAAYQLSSCKARRSPSAEEAPAATVLVTMTCMDAADRRDPGFRYEMRSCLSSTITGNVPEESAAGSTVSFTGVGLRPRMTCEIYVVATNPSAREDYVWDHEEVGVAYHAGEAVIIENGSGQFLSTPNCQKTYSLDTPPPPGSTFGLGVDVDFQTPLQGAKLINAKLTCVPQIAAWAKLGADELVGQSTVGHFAFEVGYDPSIKKVTCSEIQVFVDGRPSFRGDLGKDGKGVSRQVQRAGSNISLSDSHVELEAILTAPVDGVIVETQDLSECTAGFDVETRQCLDE